MIQSQATRYAIRGVTYLAERPHSRWMQAREVADALGVPYHFLSKIFQELVRKGILASSKGPGGGFRLQRDPAEVSLYDLIEAVEGPISDEDCLLGLEACSDEAMCPIHDFWKQFRTRFRERVQGISLVDLAEAAERKRRYWERREAESNP